MDIFTMLLSLLIIIGLIIGATIRINSLMKGKIIDVLFNKKILLIIASILAFLYTLAFVTAYLDGFVFYWDDYLWLTFSLALIFVIANFIPSVVLFLREVHQNNLEDINEFQLEDQIVPTDVQEEIKASSKEIIKNIIKLALVVAIAWFIMSGLGFVEHGDGVYPYFLSLIPIVLIVSYVLVKLPSSFKGVFQTEEEGISKK